MEKSELEQRAKARRDAALKSDTELDLEERAKARRAYMQGGPGPNDPKNVGYPGEMKYPRMEVPVGGDSRQWEQNWFEGAAATSKAKHGPAGVELELKKKLQRAKLSAKFFRQASQKDSYWEFYATEAATGKKARLFKASVDELFGREGQALDQKLWDWVSSKDYAKFAMDKMRTDGVEKVSYAMRGIGLTREGTIRMIREQAFDKARKTVLLGRRIARNLNLAEGQLKTALASDYADLQSVLEDLRLVEKTSSELLNTKASNENRFIIYKLADESLIDADLALQDVVDNVKTAEATVADKYGMHRKAVDEEMPAPGGMAAAPSAGGSTPAHQDVNYGQGGMSSSVENPDRAKQKSAPMPGGGIPYEEGGQLYPNPDERQVAPMTDQLGAAHGDLPFQEWEQLTLKNLRKGPDGKLRSFDKATWVNEPLVQNTNSTATPGGVPTGNLYESHEAGPGGGLSHVDELQEAPPGLNPDLPDGRWGFESAGEDYMHLPFGGLDGGAAPMAGAPTEEAPEQEEAPEEEKDEAAPEKEEEAPEEGDDAVSEEEEEEVEASAASLNDRRARSAARSKIMNKALSTEAGAKEDYQKYMGTYMQEAHGDAAEQKYYTQDYSRDASSGSGGSAGTKDQVDPATLQSVSKSRADAYNEAMGGGAAPAAPGAPADESEEADAEVKASFAAKKAETARAETALKQKRAYDLALDFQAKGWIEKSKEALHKQASIFASLDEKAFGNFKAMCDNVKAIAQQNVDPEKKIEQLAGHQRKVIKSGSAATSEADLLKMLSELPWK